MEPSVVISTIAKMGATPAIRAINRELNRSETVLKIRKQLRLEGRPAPDDFDSIYAYALVDYGVYKPEPILNFFRYEFVRDAFRRAFNDNNPAILEKEAQDTIDWNQETGKLGYLDYDPRQVAPH